ncbi:MAG: glycoside hydrolase family 43 protein [Kiritimatiellae bacterium]|nr:glycoside hydrolase family 43 protein [Kiritimatiellia bacterium]
MSEARYIFPSDWMADPAPHVFGGKIYIYPSHDRESGIPERDNGDHFDMVDYHVLRMDSITQERAEDCGVALELADIPWAKRQLWDSDVVEKRKYYMYFSAKDAKGAFRIGVAVADRPEGPFTPDPEPIPGSYSIDPCAFKDDDGEVYLVFGGLWGGQLQRYRNNRAVFTAEEDTLPVDNRAALEPEPDEPALSPKITKLSQDMHSFAEAPKDLVITDESGAPLLAGDHDRRFFEASWLCKKGGVYSFSWSTGDTHFICEAESDSVYGPYVYKRRLLGPQVGWTTHHGICEVDGKCWLFHHDSAPSGGRTWLRSLKLKEL